MEFNKHACYHLGPVRLIPGVLINRYLVPVCQCSQTKPLCACPPGHVLLKI